jgi:hypothetical protein
MQQLEGSGTPVLYIERTVLNTFAAIIDLSRFNNSCLRLPKISDDNNE